jgi:hypothetical protein
VDREYLNGKLGGVFLEMAERKIADDKQLGTVDIDEEFAKKVRFLRECEQNNDLAWIDFTSWRLLSSDFKTQFESILEPLFIGSGIYFRWTPFHSNLRHLVSCSHGDTLIFVLRDGNSYRVACVSPESKEYNWFSNVKFKESTEKFNATLHLGMINTSSGVIIKKFEQQQQNKEVFSERKHS